MKKNIVTIIVTAVVVFGLSSLFFKASQKEEKTNNELEAKPAVEMSSGRVSGNIIFNSLKPEPEDAGEINSF